MRRMVLSSFIRRNGKRKRTKEVEPHPHKKSSPTSESSQVASPPVFDINEGSLVTRTSPLVELNLSDSNEEWFPQELLRRRSGSPWSSLNRTDGATVAKNNSTQETPGKSSPVPSLSRSENASSRATSRKKSVPTRIIIPDRHLALNFQMGRSTVSAEGLPSETSQPHANEAPVHQSSPSVSDNLSSISGTTLVRALIDSSFVIPPPERRGSRYRSIVRQDSATLPRGSLYLSHTRSSSPIPPVPPVPALLVSVPLDPNHPPMVQSGASTLSEYPMSDSYVTSPETTTNSVPLRRISRIQEVPSPTVTTSTNGHPPTVPDAKVQRKVALVSARSPVLKDGVFDGSQTETKVSLPADSRETTLHSSQNESFTPASDDHSLDEFDFVPPEPLSAVASPKSDSSASFVPSAPLLKRSDTNRGQWKHKIDGSKVQNDSKASLGDSSFSSQQVYGISAASTSELDYGELLHYDLTVSPESSLSSSSASAGYQTFPETPVVSSPIWSPRFTFSARSDSQLLRRHPSTMRSTGYVSGHPNVRQARRQADDGDGNGSAVTLGKSQPSSSTKQKTPLPELDESRHPPSIPVNDDTDIPGNGTSQPMTNKVDSQPSVGLPSSVDRRHPLAYISTSSSYVLEEEALRALAKYSPSFSPSIIIGDVDPTLEPTTAPVSDTNPSAISPTSIPLPESHDISSFNSLELARGSTAVLSSETPPQPSLPTSTITTSQSGPSKSPSSLPSSLGGSPLPSTSPSISLDEPPPQRHSPAIAVSSSLVPEDLVVRSPSPSFVPPPPYHTVVSEGTVQHPSSTSTPFLSRTPSADPDYQCSRQASNSSLGSGTTRPRMRSRPRLPIGPRKPSMAGQAFPSFIPGVGGPNRSTSSVGSSDPTGSSGFAWRKLHAAVIKPPPKFHAPPPKWRGLTLEAAQWTFTSAELQRIVSQAIQQSSEGSALRFLRPDVLEGELMDEMQRLELQHLDVKAQYKALMRKRWMLMGALAGHVEGMNDTMTAARSVEELAEVLSALDSLTDKMHNIALQTAQLKSLRDVHNTSALAMAVRKINALFVRQMAEKERLQEQVDTLHTERDEAWKHAEDVAHDYDTLNDRMSESASQGPHGDAASATGSRRSMHISAVRKSSTRQSQAGLRSRSRSRHRRGRSSSNATRPSSLALDDIPPVPRLPVNTTIGSSALPLTTGTSMYSPEYSNIMDPSAVEELVAAQREVYAMLGMSLPTSQASSRRRTISGSAASRLPSPKSRPASESLEMRRVRRVRSRQEMSRATKSVILDDRCIRPLTIAQG